VATLSGLDDFSRLTTKSGVFRFLFTLKWDRGTKPRSHFNVTEKLIRSGRRTKVASLA
jgi:hypothetical protein